MAILMLVEQERTDAFADRVCQITAISVGAAIVLAAAVAPELFTRSTDYLGRVVLSADKYAQTFDRLSLFVSLLLTIVFVTLWSTAGRWAPTAGYFGVIGVVVRLFTVASGIGLFLFVLFLSLNTESRSVLVFLNRSDLLPGDIVFTVTVLTVGELVSLALEEAN